MKRGEFHGKTRSQLFQVHMDDSMCQNGNKISEKLTKGSIERVPHPPYSPDISPCDFWFFGMTSVSSRNGWSIEPGSLETMASIIQTKGINLGNGLVSSEIGRGVRTFWTPFIPSGPGQNHRLSFGCCERSQELHFWKIDYSQSCAFYFSIEFRFLLFREIWGNQTIDSLSDQRQSLVNWPISD
jgi:hypothetical protein